MTVYTNGNAKRLYFSFDSEQFLAKLENESRSRAIRLVEDAFAPFQCLRGIFKGRNGDARPLLGEP
jgi:hypothetical protein